jgi:hypothetical protein
MKNIVECWIKKVQALSHDEVLGLVPRKTLKKIKEKDEHPFFQAFSLIHEGVSSPKLIGESNRQPITWTRRAIQSLKKVVTKGVRLFLGHNQDNSTKNRRPLGIVVADTQKEIDGKLHHVVVLYHNQRQVQAAKNIDIVSHEGEWTFFEKAGMIFANAIEKLTGIAGMNSDMATPAFEGAKRLAMVQAMSDDTEPTGTTPEKTKTGDVMDITTVPFDDLKKEIERRNTFPHQLFDLEKMKQDRVLSNIFRENETLKKTNEEQTKALESVTAEKEKIRAEQLVLTAKPRLEKLLDDKKATDKQKTFILKKFEKTNLDDASDESLQGLIDSNLEEYKELANLFQPTDDPQNPQKKFTDPDDPFDPAVNPLLDEEDV